MSTFTVHGQALRARLRRPHEQLLEMVPELDRLACSLHDASDNLLKTFVNSTSSAVSR